MDRQSEGFPSQIVLRLPVDTISRMQNLPFCKNLYATDIGYFPEAEEHLVERPDGYPSYMLIYCLSGSGWLKANGQTHQVHEKQAFLIPANTSHSYGSRQTDNWRIYWIHFNGSHAAELFQTLHETKESPIIYLPQTNPIVRSFDEAIRWAKTSKTNGQLIAFSGACTYLLSRIAETRRAVSDRARVAEERIHQCIERMGSSLRDPLDLSRLADTANLSVPHFSSLFKKLTGSSPINLYTQLRTEKAAELLSKTQLPVSEIAREVGYTDPFYFSRAFKKSMGTSPSEYRIESRERA